MIRGTEKKLAVRFRRWSWKHWLTWDSTYPTPYFTVPGPIFWDGMAPVTSTNGVCCLPTQITSPVPQDHYAFPSSTGSTDSADPSGWLYSITSQGVYYSGSANISSLLAPATINSVLNYCSVEYPPGISNACAWSSAAAEVSAVNVAGELLTTTVHVTASTSSTPSSTPQAAGSSQRTSVPQTTTAGQKANSVSSTAAPSPSTQSTELPQSSPQASVAQSSPGAQSSATTIGVAPAVSQSSSAASAAGAAGSNLVSILGAHTTSTVSNAQQTSTLR